VNHIYCIFSPKDEVCGHPSIQHGGVTATILDQNTGVLAMLHAFDIVATSELSVKYLQPIRKG
jgi:acyl-coenzyme A thioesterase PaaI-like protein